MQVADWPSPTVILSPACEPPEHCQLPGLYGLGPPDSLRVYRPARKPLPLAAPPWPESGEGPAAESSQSLGTAVPIPLLSTCLTRVRLGLSSSFVIVQCATAPAASVIWLPFETLAPAHDQMPVLE